MKKKSNKIKEDAAVVYMKALELESLGKLEEAKKMMSRKDINPDKELDLFKKAVLKRIQEKINNKQ